MGGEVPSEIKLVKMAAPITKMVSAGSMILAPWMREEDIY
jgi:hypothetical protein